MGLTLSCFKQDFNVHLIFKVSLQFLSELNNILHVKRFTFNVKLIDDRKKTLQEKY